MRSCKRGRPEWFEPSPCPVSTWHAYKGKTYTVSLRALFAGSRVEIAVQDTSYLRVLEEIGGNPKGDSKSI